MTELSKALVKAARKVALESAFNNEEIAHRTLYWQLAECIEDLESEIESIQLTKLVLVKSEGVPHGSS